MSTEVEEEAARIEHERDLGTAFGHSFIEMTLTRQGVPKEVQAIRMAQRERKALFIQTLMRVVDLGIPSWFGTHGFTALVIRRQLLEASRELKLSYLRTLHKPLREV